MAGGISNRCWQSCLSVCLSQAQAHFSASDIAGCWPLGSLISICGHAFPSTPPLTSLQDTLARCLNGASMPRVQLSKCALPTPMWLSCFCHGYVFSERSTYFTSLDMTYTYARYTNSMKKGAERGHGVFSTQTLIVQRAPTSTSV